MNSIAQLDDDGYVVALVSATEATATFDAAVLNERPSVYHKYHLERQVWEDPRSVETINNIAKAEAVAKRGSLLLASDWTQLPNGPLPQAKQEEWAIYRQALRDITGQSGFPLTIQWPSQPIN